MYILYIYKISEKTRVNVDGTPGALGIVIIRYKT